MSSSLPVLLLSVTMFWSAKLGLCSAELGLCYECKLLLH